MIGPLQQDLEKNSSEKNVEYRIRESGSSHSTKSRAISRYIVACARVMEGKMEGLSEELPQINETENSVLMTCMRRGIVASNQI